MATESEIKQEIEAVKREIFLKNHQLPRLKENLRKDKESWENSKSSMRDLDSQDDLKYVMEDSAGQVKQHEHDLSVLKDRLILLEQQLAGASASLTGTPHPPRSGGVVAAVGGAGTAALPKLKLEKKKQPGLQATHISSKQYPLFKEMAKIIHGINDDVKLSMCTFECSQSYDDDAPDIPTCSAWLALLNPPLPEVIMSPCKNTPLFFESPKLSSFGFLA
jgi:hypothetical protein